MKAFVKRIIWIFGFGLFGALDEWLFYVTHGVPLDEYPNFQFGWYVILTTGLCIIPLLYMKDDRGYMNEGMVERQKNPNRRYLK